MDRPPFIPDEVSRHIYEMAMKPSLLSRLMIEQRPPIKPRPWYRRAWARVDRYLPRVRVSIGPFDDSCSCEGWD